MVAASSTAMLTATTVAGLYALNVEIQSGNRPQPRTRNAPRASMTLLRTATRAIAPGGPNSQFGATITIPGYTRPARRGQAQGASWWPIGGDSLVVQFTQGNQSRGEVQLRGRLQGAAMRGEVWYVSNETGNTFQLGNFSGTKSGR